MSSLTLKVGVDSAGVQAGLASAERAVARFGASIAGAVAAGFGAGALAHAAKEAVELADRFADLSKRFDISASGLQMIGNVAQREGTDIESLSQSLKFLGKNAQLAAEAGSGELVDAFAAIGVSGRDLKALKADELFLRLADAFRSGRLAGQELAVTSKLLGRGFEQAVPVLRLGREEIERIGKSKGVFSDQQIKQLEKVADLFEKINNQKKIAAGEVSFSFANSLKEFLAAGAPGTPAAALKETLFGPDMAPASGRSGGTRITRLGTSENLEDLKTQERLDKEFVRYRVKLIDAEAAGKLAAEKLAMQSDEKRAEEIKKQEEDRIQEEANQEAAYQRELFQAEMGALQQEEEFRRRTRQEAENRMGNPSAGMRGLRSSSATQELDTLAAADPQLAAMIETERKKQSEEQAKRNVQTFDARVRNETSDLNEYGGQRSLQSRREELIKKDAAREASGGKTLADIYQVLNDALREITSAPRVGAN